MKIRTIATLLFLVLPSTGFGVERGSIFRFHRVLEEYDNPAYKAYDRDILIDFDYAASNHETAPKNASFFNQASYQQSYSMTANGSAAFTGRMLRSSPSSQSDHRLFMRLRGDMNNNADVQGSGFWGHADTLASAERVASGSLSFESQLRRYMPLHAVPKRLFIELSSKIEANGYFTKRRSFHHEINESYDTVSFSTFRSQNFNGAAAVSPAIGYGKRLPIAPVYKAFEIERKLKKCNAVRSDFSRATLLKLSALCGSIESFRLSRDRPDKYYMQELERIVRADSATDSGRCDAFALFKAYETFSERFPLLFHGFEVKLKCDFWLRGKYLRPYESLAPEEVESDLSVEKPLTVAWTIPLVSRCFVEMGVNPALGDKGAFYGDGFFGAYYLVTNRIITHGAVSGIPVYLALPYDTPQRYDFTVDFYLEDNIALGINCFKYMSTKDEDQIDKKYRNIREGVSMHVDYDF